MPASPRRRCDCQCAASAHSSPLPRSCASISARSAHVISSSRINRSSCCRWMNVSRLGMFACIYQTTPGELDGRGWRGLAMDRSDGRDTAWRGCPFARTSLPSWLHVSLLEWDWLWSAGEGDVGCVNQRVRLHLAPSVNHSPPLGLQLSFFYFDCACFCRPVASPRADLLQPQFQMIPCRSIGSPQRVLRTSATFQPCERSWKPTRTCR